MSSAALPAGPFNGVVIANELLDNLPFRLAVFDGGWREVAVSLGRHSDLVEPRWRPTPHGSGCRVGAQHGTRLPIETGAATWVAAARRLLRQGTVIAFDYCTTATAELVGRPWREWLRTYRRQGRGEHYLRDPAGQDITAQVCLDQLPLPTSIELQADFLSTAGHRRTRRAGTPGLVSGGGAPDVAALMMRSRAREAEALLDPRGLGAFHVVSWTTPDLAVAERGG